LRYRYFGQVLPGEESSLAARNPPDTEYTQRYCSLLQTHCMSGANFHGREAINERWEALETSGLLQRQTIAYCCGSLSGLSTVNMSRMRTPSVRAEITEKSFPPARIARPASLLIVIGLKLN
jgi:hypothetical protein